VEIEKLMTIDNFTSEGAAIELWHKNRFIYRTEGYEGLVNSKGSIGKQAKFGYKIFNDPSRLQKPMLKVNGKWEEIGFDKAFETIKQKLSGNESETMVFAGGRLTNEELYLVHKFVRAALKTNNITSLNYLGRESGYTNNSYKNLHFENLKDAKKIYILGSDLNYDNSLVNHFIFGSAFKSNAEIILITDKDNARIAYKCSKVVKVKSYYALIKAMNKIVVDNTWYNKFYIDGNVSGFEAYYNEVSGYDLEKLCNDAGISKNELTKFVDDYNVEQNAVVVFQEKEISSNTSFEILNLAMLTGKLGKTGSGVISIKEKNNSQGLIDMGIRHDLAVGGKALGEDYLRRACDLWKVNKLSLKDEYKDDKVISGEFGNFMIFGEDPIGTAIDKEKTRSWFKNSNFMVVQDYFMTETAQMADLVLPATFHFETGGSFTNTQKFIQAFAKELQSPVEKNNLEQIAGILNMFDIEQTPDYNLIFEEFIQLLSTEKEYKPEFIRTAKDNFARNFDYSCDVLIKRTVY
jgi:predicted molibdopterin-dependent oxidoreductase YjgC